MEQQQTRETKTEAFTKIVKEYTPLLFTVCYRLVHDYQEAENLVQETFLTAYKAIDRFQGTQIRPWLIRIAVNKSKDFLKSALHTTTEPVEDDMLETTAASPPIYKELEETEGYERLKMACANLPPPYNEVALLRFVEEKSYEEIARILQKPLKTVQTQGYRAREKLKQHLQDIKEKEEWS